MQQPGHQERRRHGGVFHQHGPHPRRPDVVDSRADNGRGHLDGLVLLLLGGGSDGGSSGTGFGRVDGVLRGVAVVDHGAAGGAADTVVVGAVADGYAAVSRGHGRMCSCRSFEYRLLDAHGEPSTDRGGPHPKVILDMVVC